MKPKERYGAFLLYVDDWLSSTAIDLMTAAEERGYLRLLMHAWKADDCGLPDDARVLAQLSKLGAAWKGKSGDIVRAQFDKRDGRLFNDRLLRERLYQAEARQKRSKASQIGNDVRWGPSRIASGIPIGSQTESQSDPNSKLETQTIKQSSRIEVSLTLLTPENITEAQRLIGAHRGRNDEPDLTITRKVLSVFGDMAAFRAWAAGLSAGVDPSDITGEGFAFYLADAERWRDNGGRRPTKRPARKTTASPYFDPSVITGQPSTMDPGTKRRIVEGRKPAAVPVDRYVRYDG